MLQERLGKGEAEALTQAQEKGARIFIGDEKRAREIGEAMGLKAVGTLGVLARLDLEGYAGDIRVLVRKLRKELHYRVTDALVEEAIANASQPI